MILAGDIGGTKCNLAVFREHGPSLQLVFQHRYATSAFASLEELIETFFRECQIETGVVPHAGISAAGFGVAGAVVDGRLVANNIPWELTASALARKLGLGLEQLTLINDLVATAYGLVHLSAEDFLVLNAGVPQAQRQPGVDCGRHGSRRGHDFLGRQPAPCFSLRRRLGRFCAAHRARDSTSTILEETARAGFLRGNILWARF